MTAIFVFLQYDNFNMASPFQYSCDQRLEQQKKAYDRNITPALLGEKPVKYRHLVKHLRLLS